MGNPKEEKGHLMHNVKKLSTQEIVCNCAIRFMIRTEKMNMSIIHYETMEPYALCVCVCVCWCERW